MAYSEFSSESYNKRTNSLKAVLATAITNVENLHVKISAGNRKMGAVPSVSTLPVLDCGNCSACRKSCYDLRNDCLYNTVKNSRAANSAILRKAPDRYFAEIEDWLGKHQPNAFRWHVGGDIKDEHYLSEMCRLATAFPDTKFLAFTKMFGVVNKFHADGNVIPENLHIMFSGWVGQKMENPYNHPTTHPIFPDGRTSAHDGAKLCTGNCTECLKENRLCWNANNGDEIVFTAH